MTARPPLTAELVEQRLAESQELARLGASLSEAVMPPTEPAVLARRSLRLVARAPGRGADPRDVRLHVLACASDRQLGWMADVCVDPVTGLIVGEGVVVLVAALIDEQPLDAMPRGREGIVIVRILTARPTCLDQLPLLDRTDHRARLWLCARRDHGRTRW